MGNADVLRRTVDGPCLYTTFRTFKLEPNYPPASISFVPYQLPPCHDKVYTDQPTSQASASDCHNSSPSSPASYGSSSFQQSKVVIGSSSADGKIKAPPFAFDPAYIYDPSFVDGGTCNRTEDTSLRLDSDGSSRPLPSLNKQRAPVTEAYDSIDSQNFSVCGYATDLVAPFRHLFRDPEVVTMKDSTRLCAPSLYRHGKNLVEEVNLLPLHRLFF